MCVATDTNVEVHFGYSNSISNYVGCHGLVVEFIHKLINIIYIEKEPTLKTR